MEVENVLHMNIGNGEYSYANNSMFQESIIQKTLPIIHETIKGVIANLDDFPHCFNLADLGCASGPNTLLVVSYIIDKVHETCIENNHKVPQIQVCLNDLFGNDFNTLFKSLPMFYAKLKKEKGENFGPCFVLAIPGSFYGRLFPYETINLVHSSYSLHWLSQVPEGLENNKLNIYMAKTSPPDVFEAYRKQFEKDFTMFLQMRSQEIVRGGRMVLTFIGRGMADPATDDCCHIWELLAKSLLDMAKEELVQEDEIYTFNVPHYTPYEEEVKNIIQNEGSFSLASLKVFPDDWDPHQNINIFSEAKNATNVIRAVIEPLLMSHFGNCMDLCFKKYEMYLAKDLATKKRRYFDIVISLVKK